MATSRKHSTFDKLGYLLIFDFYSRLGVSLPPDLDRHARGHVNNSFRCHSELPRCEGDFHKFYPAKCTLVGYSWRWYITSVPTSTILSTRNMLIDVQCLSHYCYPWSGGDQIQVTNDCANENVCLLLLHHSTTLVLPEHILRESVHKSNHKHCSVALVS